MAVPVPSYYWWMDDPWACLVALGVFVFILSVVAIIFIVIAYAKHIKLINQYRVYHSQYEDPEYVEPPSFLREYEVQTLEIDVPPDDPTGLGEIDMTIGLDRRDSEGVAAFVNPTFRRESHSSASVRDPEHTTIL